MKLISLKLIFALLLFSALSGCKDNFTVEGDGKVETEKRITSTFSKILAEGDFEVTVTKGDELNILVSAESNLLPFIKTDIKGNLLHIFTQRLYKLEKHDPLKINITMPGLSGITQSGAGYIKTGKFENADFNVLISGPGNIETEISCVTFDATISGSGNLSVKGISDKSTILVSGSGKITGSELTTKYLTATISGSGNVWMNVLNSIDATILGSGNIYYSGSPTIATKIFGTGNVIKN